MKDRTVLLLVSLLSVVMVLSACGDSNSVTNPSPVLAETPQMASYISEPSEQATSSLWDASQSICDGKPLYAWRSAGTFTWRFSYPGYDGVSTVTQTEPVYSVPSDSTCGWLSVGLGEIMKDSPVEGAKFQWSGSCQTTVMGSTKTIVQQIANTVVGWEQKTIPLGTFHALRVKSLDQYADGTEPGVVEVNDWYVCGYGRIYSQSIDSNTDTNYVDQLLSFTPASTNESHVRYILADIQLMNTPDPYRAKIDNEETAEALRRWEAGIRVVNLDQFERKTINGQWQIVYRASEKLIKGTDIRLTSDLQQ